MSYLFLYNGAMKRTQTENSPENKIAQIEKNIWASVDVIVDEWHKKSWRKFTKKQIVFVKGLIWQTIQAYPPKMRPVVATIMTICYFSIIPWAGTMSLIIFGTLGRILHYNRNRKHVTYRDRDRKRSIETNSRNH